jgi:site-specific DNA-methyltransferase (adenine-specific)
LASPEIGSWYNFALEHYPRGYCKRTITSPTWRAEVGRAYQYCKNCGLTERRFPKKYRQQYPSLCFGHFSEVNACNPPLAELLLALAVTHGWTTNQLRAEVARHRNGYYSAPTTDVVQSLVDLIQCGRRFAVILADPPWKYDDRGVRGGTLGHYQVMELSAIQALKIADVAADDCTLFLWVPQSLLEEGLETMGAWGFRYARSAIWHKEPGIGSGYYARCCHEVLLIGHCGQPPTWSGNIPSVIEAPRAKHSEKPTIFHQVIERALGGLDRLDLFARRQRHGWVCVGNQLEPATHDDADS